MSEPILKCENNAIFKQKYTLKLIIAFKILQFSLKGKSIFSRFPPKKFYNINYCFPLRLFRATAMKTCENK